MFRFKRAKKGNSILRSMNSPLKDEKMNFNVLGPGGRRGGGQGKVQHRPTQPTVPTALGPRSWAGENNRVPRAVNTRWARESPSTSLGSNGRRGHHCGHRRNCKKPVRSQQTVMGLGSFTVK